MTHHSRPSYFYVFDDAAVLNPCFWRARRRSGTRATHILFLAQYIDVRHLTIDSFMINISKPLWGRVNRNVNQPGNLISKQTLEQLVIEINKMWFIGWS